jgi:hypothetical protein
MRAAIAAPASADLDDVGERFYLRAVVYGHLWWRRGEPPLIEGLRRRAARLHVARKLRSVIPDTDPLVADPALDEPIALCEAVCRSYAL